MSSVLTENYQLHRGDCLELMKNIPDRSIDLILCDLPYGTTSCMWDITIPFEDFIKIETPSGYINLTKNEYIAKEHLTGVKLKEVLTYFETYKQLGLWSNYYRIIKDDGAIVLFGQEPFSSFLRMSNLKDYKYDIYWEKERLTNIQQVKRRVGKTVETISVFYKKQCTYHPQMIKYNGSPRTNKVKNGLLGKLTDNNLKKVKEYKDTGLRYPTQVWKYQRDCLKSNLHPTQKPVKLCEDLIKTYSNEDETVLDNCMGSGSTGVACLNTNRKFISIELDITYFDIAKNRIKEAEQTLRKDSILR